MSGAREAEAERLLRALGFDARVSAAGTSGEVALLRVPPPLRERLLGPEAAEVSAELRRLGYRFVAVDLEDGQRG